MRRTTRAKGGRWLAALLAAAIPAGVVVGSDDDFFAAMGISTVVIRAPLSRLHRTPGDAVQVPGTIEIDQNPRVPVSCEAYGLSRLRECEFPPLRLRLAGASPGRGPWQGRDALRLVPPCRTHGKSDRYAVLEHLVYTGYAALAEPALRVRLVRVTLHDTAEDRERASGYGFFIEDIGEVAARRGLQWLDAPPRSLDELDAAQLTLMTLFQFMIGNTDWSAVRGPGSGRCCHNVAFLRAADGRGLVLPFDFDQSGLVDAPYAVPSPELGIRDVRQRVYRGFCQHNRHLATAIEVLNRRRPDLEALFGNPDLPYPNDRARALRYLGEFYEIVNDPKKLQQQIVRQCR